MSNKSIAVIDSGIGGLSILKDLKANLPFYDFVYFADGANMPYGAKSQKDLQAIAYKAVRKLDCFDVDLYVLACNTLTAGAIDFLRGVFPQKIFVGCEPNLTQPIKDGKKNPMVMSTVFTKNSQRINDRFGKQCRVVEFPLLAELIESHATDEKIKDYLLATFNPKQMGFDSLVLGCTHYFLKSELIQAIFGLPTYDSISGVTKRVTQLLGKTNPKYCSTLPITCFLTSKSCDASKIFDCF